MLDHAEVTGVEPLLQLACIVVPADVLDGLGIHQVDQLLKRGRKRDVGLNGLQSAHYLPINVRCGEAWR